MSPPRTFVKLARENGVDRRYYLRFCLFLTKYLLFEPFRILETQLFGRAIEATEHDAPVFILGYYRSGTTHLQELLLCDRRWAYLSFYQCVFPHGTILLGAPLRKLLNVLLKMVGFHHPAHRILLNLEMPAEEDVCMVAMGVENAGNWGQVFPRKFKAYFDKYVFFADGDRKARADFKAVFSRLVKEVAFRAKKRRILLKSPPQTARLALLRELYPKAKFIYIRRDPYFVLKSNRGLWRSFLDQQLQHQVEGDIDENILWSYEKCLEAYEHDRHAVAPNDLIEIAYEDLMKAPVATVATIYQTLELDGFESFAQPLQRYVELKHGGNVQRYKFSAADIGLVRTRMSRWLERWGYSQPAVSDAE